MLLSDIQVYKLKNKDILENHLGICLIGSSGSGKTWIIKDLLYNFRHIPIIIIISPTAYNNNDYPMFSPLQIHSEFKPEFFNSLLARQETIKNKKYKEVLIVIDDCLNDKNIYKKCPNFMKIFTQGRHLGIRLILSIQDISGLDPVMRSNIGIVFLLKMQDLNRIKKLNDFFCNMNPSNWERLFIELTKNNNSLVYNPVKNKIYSYKSSIENQERNRTATYNFSLIRNFLTTIYDPTPVISTKKKISTLKNLMNKQQNFCYNDDDSDE